MMEMEFCSKYFGASILQLVHFLNCELTMGSNATPLFSWRSWCGGWVGPNRISFDLPSDSRLQLFKAG